MECDMEKVQLARIYSRLKNYLASPEELYLVQSIEEQKLYACREGRVVEHL